MIGILGEPEIWHQHPVLEDRRGPDGDQSGEACFAEKCSNRRSVTNPPLLAVMQSIQIFIFLFHSLSVNSSHQELPTHQSVSHVSRGRSAASQAPPHAIPVLGTPTPATVPAPAPPVTLPLSMQVGTHS